jgi:hypothetical protein
MRSWLLSAPAPGIDPSLRNTHPTMQRPRKSNLCRGCTFVVSNIGLKVQKGWFARTFSLLNRVIARRASKPVWVVSAVYLPERSPLPRGRRPSPLAETELDEKAMEELCADDSLRSRARDYITTEQGRSRLRMCLSDRSRRGVRGAPAHGRPVGQCACLGSC